MTGGNVVAVDVADFDPLEVDPADVVVVELVDEPQPAKRTKARAATPKPGSHLRLGDIWTFLLRILFAELR